MLYRRTLAMILLRLIALAIIFILLTGLALPVTHTINYEEPIMLIDYSGSMKRYYPDLLDKIDKVRFPHRRMFFHETLFVLNKEPTQPASRFTDIIQAVQQARAFNPKALILISDGNHNYGNPELSDIETMDIPIYAFGVGDVDVKDARIADVVYPSYAFADDSLIVEVTIQSQGCENQTARLDVVCTTTNKRRTFQIPLSGPPAKHTTRTIFALSNPGIHTFAVELSRQPNEATYDNNRHGFAVDVFEKKIQVLYYTDHLSFTTKFVLQTLRNDPHIHVAAVTKKKNGSYYDLSKRMLTEQPKFGEFDVVILDNINLSSFTWRDPEQFLSEGKGILFMGRTEGFNQTWHNILPIPTHGTAIKGEYHLSITGSFSCLQPEEEYPPFSVMNRVSGTQEGSVIIAYTNHTPVIAYRRHRNGLIFQINAGDLGVWHFMQMAMKQTNVLSCLIGDVVRFLSTLNIHTRLVLNSLRSSYSQGETVLLTLQSYDRNFAPAPHGDFFIDVNDKSIPFFEISPGTYRTSFIPDRSGRFLLHAQGVLDSENLESNQFEITVTDFDVEDNVGLNREFMKTVATKTGGSFSLVDSIIDFQIPFQDAKKVTTYFSFDSAWGYLLICVFLALDWFMRRRKGSV
jgi:hypothetical protein